MTKLLDAIQKHQSICNKTRNVMKKIGLDGPWMDEPDRVEFEAHGFHCLLVRHAHLFHWCGYVGLPDSHPDHGKTYDTINEDVHVHGSLTFADECGGYVCHAQAGDKLYWVGFDCAHAEDLSPGMRIHFSAAERLLTKNETPFSRYRDAKWVEAETTDLAAQLAQRRLPASNTGNPASVGI